MKLLKIFREHVKMNLVHKKKFAGLWPANFWSYLGFSAGGVKFTPPPYEIGLTPSQRWVTRQVSIAD